ncbi:MAG: lipoprotein signal peptidase [Bacteroidales bacterium]|jgi:signal peptidase II|nr:lipoprotein signal peptidase [Bacteroidales bacterium]
MTIAKKSILLVLLIIILDQVLKIWIKTNMVLGQEYHILGNWFIIHFIENNGMAFGMEIAGKFGKIILSLFRIGAVAGIGWYLIYLIKQKASTGLIFTISIIMAGALGNIIDSAFYGMIFSNSYYHVASMFPAEGGYSSFLHGRVVDMFYFPVIKGTFPDWIPFRGGDSFIFFRPVFNIADSSITVGVTLILIFQKRFFKK